MKTSKIITSGAALTLAIFLGLAGVSAAAQHDGHGPANMGQGMGQGMGHHERHVCLHQPYAFAGSAGNLAGRIVRTPVAAPYADCLSH